MLWKEINSWAKKHGYKTTKANGAYEWYNIEKPEFSGIAKSVSKLAIEIFNHMTNNKWVEHQQSFEK